MGLFRKIGDVFEKIDTELSNDAQAKGKRFENHVENLFPSQWFALKEKTHSSSTNEKRYVESSLNPDFVFMYKPTKEQFAVECKFRSVLNRDGMLEWAKTDQIKRYQDFSIKKKIPVFIVIGFEPYVEDIDDDIEQFMFCIPLNEAKYPAFTDNYISKFERPWNKPFFWKDGKLT
jgi:hypothetical protein